MGDAGNEGDVVSAIIKKKIVITVASIVKGLVDGKCFIREEKRTDPSHM